jgi:dTDP-4-dehydrorhamnose reductase
MGDILVIGGSGYVGARLYHRLGANRVVATYAHRPFAGGVHFDATQMRLASTLLARGHRFTCAVLLQGVTNLDDCALRPDETAATNVAATIWMIRDLIDAGVKPVFISSDGVFDGSRGPRLETDETRPVLTYGRQKLAVEAYLSGIQTDWAVLRLTKVVSACLDRRNLLYDLLVRISEGETVRAASDQILSPVALEDVVDAIESASRPKLNGLYHVAGSQILSRLDLVTMLLSFTDQAFRDRARVEACSLDDFEFVERRPKDCSLSNRKFAAATGHKFRPLESVCRRACDAFFGGAARPAVTARLGAA